MKPGQPVIISPGGPYKYFGILKERCKFDRMCRVEVHVEQDGNGKIEKVKPKERYTFIGRQKDLNPMVVLDV